MSGVPEVAQEAVLVQSGELPVEPVEVKGYDFKPGDRPSQTAAELQDLGIPGHLTSASLWKKSTKWWVYWEKEQNVHSFAPL